MREYVIDLARQAAQTSSSVYLAWTEIFRRLHSHAVENRLRGMAMSELRMLVESTVPAADEAPLGRAAVSRPLPAGARGA